MGRLPARYISRVSSRQTRNFGFGQSSQSQLRLRQRPQKPVGALRALSSQGGPRKGLSALPLALLRSKARGSPSVASPFDGMTVHWTLICFRLTPVPGPDARNPVRARSGPTSLSSLHCPVSLERPGFAVRGEPARRGGDSLDPRLLSDSPLGAGLGERRPKNTNSKHRSSAALLTRLE